MDCLWNQLRLLVHSEWKTGTDRPVQTATAWLLVMNPEADDKETAP
jgi:hypothetical protein